MNRLTGCPNGYKEVQLWWLEFIIAYFENHFVVQVQCILSLKYGASIDLFPLSLPSSDIICLRSYLAVFLPSVIVSSRCSRIFQSINLILMLQESTRFLGECAGEWKSSSALEVFRQTRMIGSHLNYIHSFTLAHQYTCVVLHQLMYSPASSRRVFYFSVLGVESYSALLLQYVVPGPSMKWKSWRPLSKIEARRAVMTSDLVVFDSQVL